MPPSAATRSRLGLDVVPNAFKPTSEPSCSAAVPQVLGRRARVFSGLNQHHESHRHIAFSGSGLEQGLRTVSTGPGSTYTSNQRLRDRQRQNLFLGKHLLFAGNALSYPSNGPVVEE